MSDNDEDRPTINDLLIEIVREGLGGKTVPSRLQKELIYQLDLLARHPENCARVTNEVTALLEDANNTSPGFLGRDLPRAAAEKLVALAFDRIPSIMNDRPGTFGLRV